MMTAEHFLHAELKIINTEIKKYGARPDSATIDQLSFKFSALKLSELVSFCICENIFYFKSKNNDFSLLGLGQSKKISPNEVKTFLNKHPDLFLTTSFLFEEDPNNSELTLPEWLFVTRNNITELFISKSLEYQSFSESHLFFNLGFDLDIYDPFIAPWSAYEEFPEHDQWGLMIEECHKLFELGELEKIVLSRKKIFNFPESIDALAFFKILLQKNNKGLSFEIFHQTTFGEAFVSITPEQLFCLNHNQFESISLAGSAPRGKTLDEDREFEVLLKKDDKIVREHTLVTKEIERKIHPLMDELQISSIEIMKLPYIQHRSATIKGVLKKETNPLELISLLHPTPAVGGLPTDRARKKIAEIEPYKRGAYAAPIGVIGFQYSEIAVGIRSAIIHKDQLSIFGGAGILKGSLAEEEWIETATKMNPFLKVVNHE